MNVAMKNDKYLCRDCIEEEFFKEYIRHNGVHGLCSYCGNKRKIVDFELIVEIIKDGIEFIYDDPANGLGFIDGEYVKGNGDILDTYDLLTDVFDFGGSNAFQDILDSLPNQLWCNKEFYGLDAAQEKIYTWDQFVKQVKYKTRFFFIQEKSDINKYTPFSRPYDILNDFASSIEKFKLIDTIKKGDIIYRARRNDNGKKYKTAEELGTPKANECVKPNRMSPAGIPMFYGSLTKETCISELKNTKGSYTIGKWTPSKNLKILNLTKDFIFNKATNSYHYPNFPSVFDIKNRTNMVDYQFILKFASDLSGRVDLDIANIDYVPTQIVAEYLRKVALYNKKHLDGICFYSSIDGGINYALFIEQEECVKPDKWKVFEQKIELVSFVLATI